MATSSLPGVLPSTIYRTDDGGTNWDPRTQLPVTDEFVSLAAHHEGQVLVAVTSAGDTYVSRDSGSTWAQEDLTGGLPVFSMAIAGDSLIFQPQFDTRLFTVRRVTTTPGPAQPIFTPQDNQVIASWDSAGQTIAIVTIGTSGGGVYISWDTGESWDAPVGEPGGTVLVRSTGENEYILYQASRATRLHLGRDGYWMTVNQPADTIADFCRLPDATWLVVDRIHGLYNTRDWIYYQRTGVPASAVTDLAVSRQALCAGTETGTLRTSLPVQNPNWTTARGDDLAFTGNHVVDIQAWVGDPSVLWRTRRVNLTCAIERSTDAGQTWTSRGSFPDVIFAAYIDPNDHNHVMHSFGRLSRKNPRRAEILGVRTTATGGGASGQEWDEHAHGHYYLELTADPNVRGRIWMASYTNGLYYTDDFGESAIQATHEEANTVLVSGSRVLIGGDTVRYRDDSDTGFREALLEGISDPVRVVALAQYNTALFAATASLEYPGQPVTAGHGVLRSLDNGSTWHNISGDLASLDVRALAVDPAEPCLYAGLWGGSVHRLPLT
ncbi:hypothetical protein QZH56_13115 [Streptomyces olivoreticuli]|uniref:hypothetical protein n=1 Tax=Streptomyces olivoreticuli TaxID=68246 RepID=UPI002657F6E3|nr:hypothetical protein [Streptomyces olivoreticuli]WKK26444.1 hypothetical protein QZH56_13115 [Streptomyces olivoreticuli]